MTHYLRIDSRINTVKKLIKPIQIEFEKIIIHNKKEEYIYWDSVYSDDAEHLVGIVFIVLQNYINSSISDLFPDLKEIHSKYQLDKEINNSKTTRIELINAIANYYKHRDLPKQLHGNTAKYLENLEIEYKNNYDLENGKYSHKLGAESPVFKGLSYLSDSWDLNDLIDIVSDWREQLWLKEEDKNDNYKKSKNSSKSNP
jgi:hypothetical protein